MGKKKGKMAWLDYVAFVLMAIGGLNWGLMGAFSLNLVTRVTGSLLWLTKTVYILVGLASLYWVVRAVMLKLK